MGVKLKERRPGEWWLYVHHKSKRFAKKVGTDKRAAIKVAREVEKRLARGDLGTAREGGAKVQTFPAYAAGYFRAARAHAEIQHVEGLRAATCAST